MRPWQAKAMSERPFPDEQAFNQSPPFQDVNLFTSDTALQEAVRREGAASAYEDLSTFGALAGSAASLELGRLANEHPPQLESFDPRGDRIDHVEFHPAYHQLMAISTAQGLHCSTWEHLLSGTRPKPGAHVARCAGSYMAAQMEAGHCCPITMTHAAVASLRHAPGIARDLVPKIVCRSYDSGIAPIGEKSAITLGMGMTERQGGTDVRANTTRAEPVDGRGVGKAYGITGHKWFLSAPMSDAFLLLAQAEGGLSCFLLRRLTTNGALNGLKLQRLKDKLGNRSNASVEVEFDRAEGLLVGEEGRGIATIIDMVTLTRLDCAVSSAGLMRLALARAIHCEDASEVAYRRLMTPVTKYWVCKTAPSLAYEAMECLGGNGYVEDGGFPRLYREVPVNAIWEGSGNVMCLDVLRVVEREPDAFDKVLAEIEMAGVAEPRLKEALTRIKALARDVGRDQTTARTLVELLALAGAASLLASNAPHAMSDAFLATRLQGSWRNTYGAGIAHADTRAIVARAAPQHQ